MKKRFHKQIVVVTGASSGIGKATAKLFAKEGAITVLVARTEHKLLQVSEEIGNFGGHSLIIPTDIRDERQVSAMVNHVFKKFGRIDLLFNNAGTSYVGEVKEADFIPNLKRMMETDFMGSVYSVKAVLPIMLKQNYGHIINMSSVVGLKAFAKFTGYSSAMHAITGFTDGLRQELENTRIKVTVIHPALTRTGLLDHVLPEQMPEPFKVMTPMTPEQVAKMTLSGILKGKQKIVIPFQPKVLILLNAFSTRLGDAFVRFVSRQTISRILGMYRGKLYHDTRQQSS